MKPNISQLRTVDGETLMSQPLRPPDFVVSGLLSKGLHILAGSPKVGKSWLALWLAVTVAKGEPVWGMNTQQGTTLYLCLEDSVLRIQNRLFEITEDAPESAPEGSPAGTLADGLEYAEAEAPEGWDSGAIYAFYLDGEFIGRLSEGYIEDYGGMDAAADRLYLEYLNRTAPEFSPEDVEIDCDVSYIPQDVLDHVLAWAAGVSQDDWVLWNTLESELTGLELEMNVVIPIPDPTIVEFYSAEYRLTPDRPELVDESYTLDDEGRVVQDAVFAFILEDGGRVPVRPRNDWPIVINDESDYAECASLCVQSYETGAEASRAEFDAPEGVDMGEFSRDYGDYGGWVSAETAFGGYGSGALAVTAPAASVTALAADKFSPEKISDNGDYIFGNHHWCSDMQSAAGLGEGAYVCREYADLYVGADFDALWQQGLDVDFETMSFQSDYHTVFLTRPESPVVWKLSLAANMFTREDVLALAESFVWPN